MSILLISIVGLLVIACGIVCTLKKCRLGPLPRTPDSWTPDCPETSFGMLQVTSGGARRAEDNTYVVQQPPLPRRPTDSSTASPNYVVVGDRPGSSSGSSTVTGRVATKILQRIFNFCSPRLKILKKLCKIDSCSPLQ